MRLRNFFYTVLIVLLVAVIVRAFFIDTFLVRGDSMTPTINDGELVMINRLAYVGNIEPERGDIIVVHPRDSLKKIVKRVVGLSRDTLEFRDNSIIVRDDGVVVMAYKVGDKSEQNGTTTSKTFYETLDPKEYFVLGDNYAVSIDSRELDFVDKWDVKGRVFMILSTKSIRVL